MKKQKYFEAAIEYLRQKPTDDCILWPFTKSKPHNGYGQLTYNGEVWTTHRLAYQLYYDKKPNDMVLHKCGNHSCFNPLHLYEGTASQNIQDMIEDWGMAPGGRRKLTEEDVAQIIGLLRQGDLKQREIAARFNVSGPTISSIKTGRAWQHISRSTGKRAPRKSKISRAQIFQYNEIAVPQSCEKEQPSKQPKSKQVKVKSPRPQRRRIRIPVERKYPVLEQAEIETMRGLFAHGFNCRELAHLFGVKPFEIKELVNKE